MVLKEELEFYIILVLLDSPKVNHPHCGPPPTKGLFVIELIKDCTLSYKESGFTIRHLLDEMAEILSSTPNVLVT